MQVVARTKIAISCQGILIGKMTTGNCEFKITNEQPLQYDFD